MLIEQNKMFSCGPLYHENLNAKDDIVINQGGTDSGKTYAIMQVLFTIATTWPKPDEDATITIVGESVPNLKKGAYKIAQSIYSNSPDLSKYVLKWNETDRKIYFRSGWEMEFVSYENEQQAKQGKRRIAFFNEANGISWPIFWQCAKRVRDRTFIDYNPSAPFFVHEKLIGTTPNENDLSATVKLIISDHRHNPFLSAKDHRRTENIKDPDRWKVYARGLTGNLEGLIFPNFKEIPTEGFPKQDVFYGLDFGYENDPTALMRVTNIGNNMYVDEVAYQSGDIPPRTILQLLKDYNYRGETVFCEHDPDQIAQLRALNIQAIPARKGPGSIKAGIQKIKEYNVFYTARSANLKEELKRYMWEIDKATGKPTNTPVAGWDHACFVGNTQIETIEGQKNISDIIIGDLVLTSKGYKKVLKLWENGVQNVERYTFKCDELIVYLECTPSHLIKTNNELWKPVSKLRTKDMIFLSKNLTGKYLNCIQRKDIIQEAEKECTLKSGNPITEKCHKVIMFIIGTKIRTITVLKTLNLKTAANILANTVKSALPKTKTGLKNSMQKGLKLQRHGTEQMKVSNSIKNRRLKAVLENGICQKKNATNVKNSTSLKSITKDFAETPVNQNLEDNLESTTIKEPALNVVRNLQLTNTPRLEHVTPNVLQNIDIKQLESQLVYDLHVEDCHEYFANGVLVHNCDSLRYAIYTKFFRA